LKKAIFIIFIFITFIHASEQKNILILNSYHQGMTWVQNITKGVTDTFEIKKNNYIVHIENMDTKRHAGKEYFESLASLYQHKYSNIKFDLILSSDNNALDFLKKYRNKIFGDIPVAFSGINNFSSSILEGHKNYTGVIEKISVIKNIDLIIKLHPKVKNIYIINDYLKSGRAFEQTIKAKVALLDYDVNIIYNKKQSLEELKEKIKSFKKDTVILMGNYFADKNKKYLTFEKTGEYLLDISPVPVYCLLQFHISNGVIGGDVISGYYQGAMMAKLGKNILNGVSPKNINIVKDGSNQYIFNQKALDKFNISNDLLPQDSILINNNISIYEKYGSIISINLLFLSFLIVTMIVFYYKKELFNEQGILKIIVYGPLIFIPAIIGILIYSILDNNQTLYKNDIKVLKKEYLKDQKNIAFKEIEKTARYVYTTNSKMKAELRKDLKVKVEQAYTIADNIYKENKDTKSDDDIKKIIIDALSKIRFYDNRGYYFINTNDGVGVLLNGISELKKKPNLLDLKDHKGNYIIRDQIKKIKENKSGYNIKYYKELNTNKYSKKLSYIKLFEPYDWHIGTGEYIDGFDDDLKQDVFNYITNIKYGKSGYLFALNSKGIVLAHGSMPNIVGIDMSQKFDVNNVYYTQEIIKKAMLNSSRFTKYSWHNPETNKIDIKYTYSAYIPEYDMIIGTGVYNNDIERIVQNETIKLKKKNDAHINKILIISLIVLILALGISLIISNMIKKIFKNYKSEIDSKNKALSKLNNSLEDKIANEIKKSKHKDSLIFQQSKMASMGEMIGNIAHQWRQPLSVISTGASGLLVQKEHNILKDEVFEYTCKLIDNNAQYLSKTIDDFKNFIKNDREKVNFNLKENLDSFLNLVSGSMKNYDINMVLDLDENIVLLGYPNELIQCFMNIFNNAKDALKEIESDKYIFITTKIEDENVFITFKDNAGGIKEEILPKIFEPYFTTKHKSQGTGLGLSMTYRIIVDGMNGSLAVETVSYTYDKVEFQGAQFTISLKNSK